MGIIVIKSIIQQLNIRKIQSKKRENGKMRESRVGRQYRGDTEMNEHVPTICPEL